ncbi:hypothetical protein DFR50_15716 [Roseiarcus fermentans]|uniref:Uncharacterized protein n=1 Tax=Roseiarcus fermentans TaxID=1473586 RepID=A0A366EFS5_9HYPH|nr:hypothetical protein DFR50_15716 [Roseiarcus fermentans]
MNAGDPRRRRSSLRARSAGFREVRLRARHARSAEKQDSPRFRQFLAGHPDLFYVCSFETQSRPPVSENPPPAQEAFRIPDKFGSCAPDGTAKAGVCGAASRRWLQNARVSSALRSILRHTWDEGRGMRRIVGSAVASGSSSRASAHLGNDGRSSTPRRAMMLPDRPREEPEERRGDPGVACADVDARRSGAYGGSWPRPLDRRVPPDPSQDPSPGVAPREDGGSAAASGTQSRRKLLQCLVSGAETMVPPCLARRDDEQAGRQKAPPTGPRPSRGAPTSRSGTEPKHVATHWKGSIPEPRRRPLRRRAASGDHARRRAPEPFLDPGEFA